MPSNNNSNKNSNKNSMSFGKGKNNSAMIGFFVIIIGVAIGYYYIYQSNRENFDGQNLTPASGEVIVALFYAPWCGHCKTFKPIFQDAMTKLDGKTSNHSSIKGKTVRLSMIDCDKNPELGKKYSINGYPTVKILKDDGSDMEYDGGRTLEGMKKFLVVDN
jgi:protein disulfide-isomerase A6